MNITPKISSETVLAALQLAMTSKRQDSDPQYLDVVQAVFNKRLGEDSSVLSQYGTVCRDLNNWTPLGARKIGQIIQAHPTVRMSKIAADYALPDVLELLGIENTVLEDLAVIDSAQVESLRCRKEAIRLSDWVVENSSSPPLHMIKHFPTFKSLEHLIFVTTIHQQYQAMDLRANPPEEIEAICSRFCRSIERFLKNPEPELAEYATWYYNSVKTRGLTARVALLEHRQIQLLLRWHELALGKKVAPRTKVASIAPLIHDVAIELFRFQEDDQVVGDLGLGLTSQEKGYQRVLRSIKLTEYQVKQNALKQELDEALKPKPEPIREESFDLDALVAEIEGVSKAGSASSKKRRSSRKPVKQVEPSTPQVDSDNVASTIVQIKEQAPVALLKPSHEALCDQLKQAPFACYRRVSRWFSLDCRDPSLFQAKINTFRLLNDTYHSMPLAQQQIQLCYHGFSRVLDRLLQNKEIRQKYADSIPNGLGCVVQLILPNGEVKYGVIRFGLDKEGRCFHRKFESKEADIFSKASLTQILALPDEVKVYLKQLERDLPVGEDPFYNPTLKDRGVLFGEDYVEIDPETAVITIRDGRLGLILNVVPLRF